MIHEITTALPPFSFDDDLVIQTGNGEEKATREEFYTNYPFFKYWKTDANNKLLNPEGINIYLHIPFCIQICDYCFYMKELVKSKSQVDDYIENLCREIRLVSEKFSLRHRNVNTIYMGGGTPSVLTESQFRRLINTLRQYHNIDQPEFTFEAEPGTFTAPKLKWYKDSGVNRISMGVQSFVDDIIKRSSRKHTVRQAMDSIRMVKEEGGFHLNVDLLSGLAGETMDSWEETMKVALSQPIDMVTIYKMKAYANTAFFKKGVQQNEIVLPSADEELQFITSALDLLSSAGYQRWSSFAFTKDGYCHQYIENTWRGQDLVAYGVSSFGKMGAINYQNVNNLASYSQKVQENTLPVFRSFQLSFKDQMVRELLLCATRLSSYRKKEFIEKFGFDYARMIPEKMHQLMEKGFLQEGLDEIRLTKKGIIYADFVSKTIASAAKEALEPDNIGFTY